MRRARVIPGRRAGKGGEGGVSGRVVTANGNAKRHPPPPLFYPGLTPFLRRLLLPSSIPSPPAPRLQFPSEAQALAAVEQFGAIKATTAARALLGYARLSDTGVREGAPYIYIHTYIAGCLCNASATRAPPIQGCEWRASIYVSTYITDCSCKTSVGYARLSDTGVHGGAPDVYIHI